MPTRLSDKWPEVGQHVTATRPRSGTGSDRDSREAVRCSKCGGSAFRVTRGGSPYFTKLFICLGCGLATIAEDRPSTCFMVEWALVATQNPRPGTPRV